MLVADGYITGWNITSEVHVLDPVFDSGSEFSRIFRSLPNVNMTFYYTIR